MSIPMTMNEKYAQRLREVLRERIELGRESTEMLQTSTAVEDLDEERVGAINAKMDRLAKEASKIRGYLKAVGYDPIPTTTLVRKQMDSPSLTVN